MRINWTLSIGLVFIFVTACNKKFDHSSYIAETATEDCLLCDYADSISGNYKGVYFPTNTWPSSDSIIVELEHVFLNITPHTDSTVMFFKMKRHYNNGNTTIKMVSLNNDNGLFYDVNYGNHMYLDGDSLHYQEGFHHKMGFTPVFFFDGKKTP